MHAGIETKWHSNVSHLLSNSYFIFPIFLSHVSAATVIMSVDNVLLNHRKHFRSRISYCGILTFFPYIHPHKLNNRVGACQPILSGIKTQDCIEVSECVCSCVYVGGPYRVRSSFHCSSRCPLRLQVFLVSLVSPSAVTSTKELSRE